MRSLLVFIFGIGFIATEGHEFFPLRSFRRLSDVSGGLDETDDRDGSGEHDGNQKGGKEAELSDLDGTDFTRYEDPTDTEDDEFVQSDCQKGKFRRFMNTTNEGYARILLGNFTLEKCEDICGNAFGCAGYSWMEAHCSVLFDFVDTDDLTPLDGAVAGIPCPEVASFRKDCPSSGFFEIPNTEIQAQRPVGRNGGLLEFVLPESCALVCGLTQNCFAYSYADYKCYLKGGEEPFELNFREGGISGHLCTRGVRDASLDVSDESGLN